MAQDASGRRIQPTVHGSGCILIVLGSLVVRPALPDIVDVTVNGSISGDGYIDVACGLATPGCIEVVAGEVYRLQIP